MPLVPFPDRESPVLFLNPEHISALSAHISNGTVPVLMSVRLKVTGMTEMTIKLGTFETHEAAEARWQELLRHLGNVVGLSEAAEPPRE